MFTRLIVLLTVLLSLSGVAFAADAGLGSQVDADQPIEVKSDRLEADETAGRMRFVGNVVAKQGSMTLYAGELAIFYGGKSQQIERIEALRDVRIVQGAKVATGQKGIFYNREGKIVLSGSPKIHQGDDFISGDEITVFLNEEKSIVTGREGARVNAVFHPKGEKK